MRIPFFARRTSDFALTQLRGVVGNKRIIIVGCGKAGARLHMEAFRQAGIEIVAVCDPNIELAEETALKNDIKYFYEGLEEALKEHDVHVVSICTPPQSHLALTTQAMNAGIHVLLEKPLTYSREEIEELEQLRDRSKSKLVVVHNKKFYPGMMTAKDAFEGGLIGELLQVNVSWITNGENDRMIVLEDQWSNKLVGGRWGETLPHLLYLPYQWCGEMKVLSVGIKTSKDRWPWLAGHELAIQLEAKRCFVNLRLGASLDIHPKFGYTDYIELFGTRGVIAVFPDSCFLLERDKDLNVTFRNITEQKYMRNQPVLKDGHDLVVKQFLEHVFLNAPAPTTWSEARHVMELTLDIGEIIDKKVKAASPTLA